MKSNLVRVILVLLGAVASVNCNNCGLVKKGATQLEQSIDVYTNGPDIPSGHHCSWTVDAPQGKEIDFYLKVDNTSIGDHCVQVFNSIQTISVEICPRTGYNLVTFRQPAIVKFPVAGREKEYKNFKIYYKLSNSEHCGATPEEATLIPQQISVYNGQSNVPQNHQCTWTISAPNKRRVDIYMEIVGDASEKQCVQVFNPNKNTIETICRKPGRNLITTEQPVTVIYTGPSAGETYKNFQIFYKITNSKDCGGTPKEATLLSQSFLVYNGQSTIPQNHQCTWTISAPDTKSVDVYLETVGQDVSEKQCVQVLNPNEQSTVAICQKNGNNSFTIEQPVTVIFSGTSVGETFNNFRVFYKIANSKFCDSTPRIATQIPQPIAVYTGPSTIPQNHRCAWTISAPGKNIINLYMGTVPDPCEKNCLQVFNPNKQTTVPICRKHGNNSLNTEQPVIVIFPGPPAGETFKNFRIFYKIPCESGKTCSVQDAKPREPSVQSVETKGSSQHIPK